MQTVCCVAIDESGNRVPVFVFNNLQNGSYVATIEIDMMVPASEAFITTNATVYWPGGSTVVPRDIPICGFFGQKCSQGYSLIMINCRLIQNLNNPLPRILDV